MKSQLTTFQTAAAPAHVRTLAALGLAAAALIAWPDRSQAHEAQGHAQHSLQQGGHGFGGARHEHSESYAGHAVHADWHGGGGLHTVGVHGVGVHGVGFGPHGYVGVGYGGRWNHGWHGGVYGWWYIDGGIWTPYPYYVPYGYYPPYYGYPAYPYGYVPPDTTVANRNLPPQQASWYYCDASRAYYPYVQSCASGWRPVSAQPAPAAAAVPPPPAGQASAPAPLTAPPQ